MVLDQADDRWINTSASVRRRLVGEDREGSGGVA
jgi:hypothetical protein